MVNNHGSGFMMVDHVVEHGNGWWASHDHHTPLTILYRIDIINQFPSIKLSNQRLIELIKLNRDHLLFSTIIIFHRPSYPEMLIAGLYGFYCQALGASWYWLHPPFNTVFALTINHHEALILGFDHCWPLSSTMIIDDWFWSWSLLTIWSSLKIMNH